MRAAVCLLLFLVSAHSVEPAHAQRRMKKVQSYSEVLRDTNPKAINSVGKIEGNEVPKDAPVEEVEGYDVGTDIKPTPDPNVDNAGFKSVGEEPTNTTQATGEPEQ